MGHNETPPQGDMPPLSIYGLRDLVDEIATRVDGVLMVTVLRRRADAEHTQISFRGGLVVAKGLAETAMQYLRAQSVMMPDRDP